MFSFILFFWTYHLPSPPSFLFFFAHWQMTSEAQNKRMPNIRRKPPRTKTPTHNLTNQPAWCFWYKRKKERLFEKRKTKDSFRFVHSVFFFLGNFAPEAIHKTLLLFLFKFHILFSCFVRKKKSHLQYFFFNARKQQNVLIQCKNGIFQMQIKTTGKPLN